MGGELNGRRFAIPFITGARPGPRFGAITEIRSAISSEYEALVLQAERRLTAGLQFQTSYTLSRSPDNGSAD
ncbi:MAG: hypothetical protein LC672_00745 [Acidobacteria bacterium]|nr:hypothetical protein [Acidobacteriota bacterium]